MNVLDLNGKRMAILAMGKTAEGEDEWAVFAGVARVCNGALLLERDGKPSFEIRSEWISRIRPVSADVREILNRAVFYLPLTIGPLPEGEATENYLQTGWQWPL